MTTTGASPLIALSPVRSPTRVRSVAAGQVAVLLVRQGLERRGVEGLAALGERLRHGVLGHDRLARACRRRHEHGAALVQRIERPQLEGVEPERVLASERQPGHFFRMRPMRIEPS